MISAIRDCVPVPIEDLKAINKVLEEEHLATFEECEPGLIYESYFFSDGPGFIGKVAYLFYNAAPDCLVTLGWYEDEKVWKLIGGEA